MYDLTGRLLLVFLAACALSAPAVRAQAPAQVAQLLRQWGALNPQGIAVDVAGDVYVVETNLHRVQKFDSDGVPLAQMGSFGRGAQQFNRPMGIAVDADGNIYVADMGNHRVQKYSRDFTHLAQFGSQGSGGGQLRGPRGVAVDLVGNVYIADTGNHRIQKFAADGTYLAQWGELGRGDGQLSSPSDLATDAAAFVYVLDTNNHRVQKFAADGSYLTQWGELGRGDGQFQALHGMGIDAIGNVYVADKMLYRVQRFSSDGTYLDQWGNGDRQAPTDVAINADGEVYVSNRETHRIQHYALSAAPPSPPVAYAGQGQTTILGTTVPLDGSGSRDPNGDPLTYRWAFAAGGQPAGSTVALPTERSTDPKLEFTPDVEGRYTIELVVGDGQFTSAPAAVTITAIVLRPPVVDAGPDQTVLPGATVELDGSGSRDPNGFPLTYRWQLVRQPAGSTATLVFAAATDPIFIPGVQGAFAAPSFDGATALADAAARPTFVPDVVGTYVVELVVADSELASDPDPVTIIAQPELLQQWRSPLPSGVMVDAAGDLYVTDIQNHGVVKYDGNGVLLGGFGRSGTGGGQFNQPRQLAANAAGELYVVDHINSRIQKFNSNGGVIALLGSQGSGDGQFINPRGVAVDTEGNVYVGDMGNNRIQKFTPDGTYLEQWGSQGSGDGQFQFPRVVIAKTGFARKEIFAETRFVVRVHNASLFNKMIHGHAAIIGVHNVVRRVPYAYALVCEIHGHII